MLHWYYRKQYKWIPSTVESHSYIWVVLSVEVNAELLFSAGLKKKKHNIRRVARKALMTPFEREAITDGQIKEIVVNILEQIADKIIVDRNYDG